MTWDPYIDAGGMEEVEREALVPLYEEALRDQPDDLDTLIWLAHAYTRMGRVREGLKLDLRLSRLLPDESIVHYNLACSYSLLGNPDRAMKALRKAVRLGYRELAHMLEDEDLQALRDDPRFRRLLRDLER